MKNFLQNRLTIIQEFCDTFKKGAYKDIWGISKNCNVKNSETVWLNKSLLTYQTLSEDGCASGCTMLNPSFVITQYAAAEECPVFPAPFVFDPCIVFSTTTMRESYIGCGGCCYTNITVNNGSNVTTYNFVVTNMNSTPNQPIDGATVFTYAPLVGKSIQLALSGYGFFNPGTDYTFDNTTGTITLLRGLLFNLSEVYTIFAYT